MSSGWKLFWTIFCKTNFHLPDTLYLGNDYTTVLLIARHFVQNSGCVNSHVQSEGAKMQDHSIIPGI